MATILATPRVAMRRDRMFYSGMALAMLATVFIGFAPTYYLLPYLHGVTASGFADGATLTPLVHVHAVVFSAWMLLFMGQTGLIAARRVDLHRLLGMASLAVAAAVVVIGAATAINAGRLGHAPPGWNDRAFLIVPLANLALFGGFVAFGAMRRGEAAFHKRLMLIATINLLIPACARIARMIQPAPVPAGPVGGMIIADLFLVALVAFDLTTRRRLHPVTLWGGGVFLVSQPLRIAIGETAAWHAFAATLIG